MKSIELTTDLYGSSDENRESIHALNRLATGFRTHKTIFFYRYRHVLSIDGTSYKIYVIVICNPSESASLILQDLGYDEVNFHPSFHSKKSRKKIGWKRLKFYYDPDKGTRKIL